jgi:chemotaxis protein methyltransferase CheR
MQIDVVPDALWQRVSEFIAQHTGLDFPGERRSDLQRGLAAAAAEFGLADAAGCADWLLSTSPTRPQWNIVASHLTIGETYFYREKNAFDALAEHVLPELIRRRRGREQRLRLWSAACSTGEEPYSLAILVRQLLPDWQDWTVTILATDINERFLQRAEAGIYGEWSFRESAAGFKERYFTATSNGRYAIAPQIRNCVSFAQLNLAQDYLLAPAADAHGMDVIFCRNVLIYFTASHARKLAENLHRALADGGWLAVGPSECSQTLFSSFAAVNFPGAILYRKCKTEERGPPIWLPAADAVAERVAAFDARPPSKSYAPQRDSESAGKPRPPAAAAAAQTPPAAQIPPAAQTPPASSEPAQIPGPISLQTRALANQGQHADALVSSERWIASDKMDSAAHYMHAMILQEMGERQAARDSLHRAVYLQPDFALAHFALGNLARAEARTAQANKHFANALHLLRICPPDALLPESDGMSAGRLAEIITTLLAPPDRPVSAPEASPNDQRGR